MYENSYKIQCLRCILSALCLFFISFESASLLLISFAPQVQAMEWRIAAKKRDLFSVASEDNHVAMFSGTLRDSGIIAVGKAAS